MRRRAADGGILPATLILRPASQARMGWGTFAPMFGQNTHFAKLGRGFAQIGSMVIDSDEAFDGFEQQVVPTGTCPSILINLVKTIQISKYSTKHIQVSHLII